jgi:hypothetical protein
MKDYLALWAKGVPNRRSRVLTAPITVVGERKKALGPKSEFARVQLTVHPADAFEVSDNVAERRELEELGVEWPDPVIFGVLDVLMRTEPDPLSSVRVILEEAWYHDVDSSENAFRHAGRDAGEKIIKAIAGEADPFRAIGVRK